jgi:hypothetical protein
MGIDKPLRLVFFDYRLEDLIIRQRADLKANEAQIFLDFSLLGNVPSELSISVHRFPLLQFSLSQIYLSEYF